MAEGDKNSGGQGGSQVKDEIILIEENASTGVVTGGDQDRRTTVEDQHFDDDDGGEAGDTRLGQRPGTGAGDGQETQAELSSRQRRRQRERQARAAERAELMRLRQENNDLKQRQVATDRRITSVETTTVESQIAGLESEIQRADAVMARALTSQSGEDFVEAQKIRDVLRDRLSDLRRFQAARKADGGRADGAGAEGGDQRRGVQPGVPPGMTPAQMANGRLFMSKHPWYHPQGRDDDSQTVTDIDNQMMTEGWNPSTADYWVELERRIYDELPHRAPRAGADNGGSGDGGGDAGSGANNGRGNGAGGARPRGPRLPGGSGGGGEGAPTKFHLSPERKEALVALGVYDPSPGATQDMTRLTPYIKRFMAWDKAEAESNKGRK